MATIPSGQKFHTIAADVDTMNRGSASANADRTIFTMADIVASIPSGLSGSGTAGKVSRFTASDTIADSLIGDDGTTVSLGTDITIGDSIKFSEDSTSKFGFVAGQDNFFIYNENSLQFECSSTTTTLYHSGVYKFYTASNGVKLNGQITLLALNTAPLANNSEGTLGEIRWTEGFVYICTLSGADGAANWNRATLTSGW
jgi:hypothetical protein